MPKKRERAARHAHSIPLGVKIISIITYIGAGLMALFAILLFISTAWISSTQTEALRQLTSGFGAISSEITQASVMTYTILAGVIYLLLAVINFFVGRGLWFRKQWARILVIIYAVIQIISSIGAVTSRPGSAILAIIIYGVIGGYLAFSKEVKKFFS